jgi:hypothetical protein
MVSKEEDKMKITTERLKEIIKEEIEVTLTNEEAAEMFGDEVVEGLDEGIPGIENITPDNVQMAVEALMQVAETFSPAVIVPALYTMLKQLGEPACEQEEFTDVIEP